VAKYLDTKAAQLLEALTERWASAKRDINALKGRLILIETAIAFLSEDLVAANLRDALDGENAGWLRASLALAERSDLIAMALDAAVLASVLSQRALAQLEQDIHEREKQT
jgi:hypothetical protein